MHFESFFPTCAKRLFSGWDRHKTHERNQYTATLNIEGWNALSVAPEG
jgi:hypothetical protein